MSEPTGQGAPVKTKAVIIDPESMAVVWMNESASEGLLVGAADSLAGVTIDQLVPMAEQLGVVQELRNVAETGVARHLHVNLVSTVRGSVAVVTSVYRMRDGMVLMLTENAWQPTHGTADGGGARRPSRRTR